MTASRTVMAAMLAAGSINCASSQTDEALANIEGEEARAAAFGEPLPGLNAEQKAAFTAGHDAFVQVETVEDGLGPVFNEAGCAVCHVGPGTAIGGTNGRLETRFGRIDAQGRFDPMAASGGSLLQDRGIGILGGGYEYFAEKVPAAATVVAHRRTTPLFGLGLVDSVPDGVFRALAKAQAILTPRTAGVASAVTDVSTGQPAVGKFGWKAQVPTLFVFSGDAYLNEMGITNPLFKDESCPEGDCTTLDHNPRPDLNDDGDDLVRFTDFMRLLAPPPRGPLGATELAGELVALRTGCFECHLPVLKTGNSDVAALRYKVFRPFSDFLLHDMGSLGDGITQNQATGRLMRTAPLWGLRTQATLLHDGRATTIAAAIEAHDGQGRFARDKFRTLSTRDRDRLLAFLKSL
jgi:CxxC motif-containing protein (DUF1111 family)